MVGGNTVAGEVDCIVSVCMEFVVVKEFVAELVSFKFEASPVASVFGAYEGEDGWYGDV